MPLLLGYVPGTDLDHGFFFYPSDQKIIGCDTTISTYIYIINICIHTHTRLSRWFLKLFLWEKG